MRRARMYSIFGNLLRSYAQALKALQYVEGAALVLKAHKVHKLRQNSVY